MSGNRSTGSTWTSPLRVGLTYLLLSVVWIYFSDLAVERLFTDPSAIRRVQTLKGWAFVGASTAVIVFLVHRELVRLRRVAVQYQALVEQSLAGVYLIQHGRFRYVNPTLARLFGYEPREMIGGLRVEDVVARGDRALILGNVGDRIEGVKDELRYRFEGIRKDGGTVPVEVHGNRIMWEGAPAVMGVLLDVGERERLEHQVREAQKMEALGKLTGQVAHDFNNFLTGIIGPLDLCRRLLPPDSEALREVEEARETAMRAGSLSRKLLSFSRHRATLPRPVAVNESVRASQPLLRRLIPHAVELRLELQAREDVVSIDPSALEQVLVNLVMNAGEAIDGRGTVVVRTHNPGRGFVSLEVEDDGAGMDPEDVPKIFEPFFTTKEDGTGLGLSTVYGVATQAGGRVEADSEPGAGTCLRIVLPRAEGDAARRPEPGTQGLHAPEGLGEVVLVVEDESVVLRTIEKALERAGYKVLGATDGRAALDLARQAAFDLLLTDVQLPDASGPELAAKIARMNPGAAVLFMSGYSSEAVTDTAAGDVSVRLLEKPFSMDELIRAVRDALSQRGSSQSAQAG